MKSVRPISVVNSSHRISRPLHGDFKTGVMAARDESSRQLAFFGALLHKRHYVSGCDGNLSVRLGQEYVLTTPTGFSKAFMKPQEMVVVDFDGNKVDGFCEPTSEIGMHLAIYKARSDINAVVHAHPCVSTGFASAGIAMTDAVCSELVSVLGEVPLAPYAPSGTKELVEALEPLIIDHHAILMENHGVVTYADTLEHAYLKMETVEHCARILLTTRLLGRCRILTASEIAQLRGHNSTHHAASRPIPD